ncbi:hypothetical protein Tco_0011629 [Tanacetum coccineum]
MKVVQSQMLKEEPIELVEDKGSAEKGISATKDKVSTADLVTTACETITTASVNPDDVALAETLMAIRSSASRPQKLKGVSILIETSEQQHNNIKDLTHILAKDKRKRHLLQAEKREKISVEEQARLLMEFIAARKKFFATKRAEEQRNNPPTKAEQKKKMCTYMKHMVGIVPKLGSYALGYKVIVFLDKHKMERLQAGGTLASAILFDKRLQMGNDCVSYKILKAVGNKVDSIGKKQCSIHMLVEKKYPLTQEMLSRMLSGRLEVDHECEMAFELLKFTRSQLKKYVRLDNQSIERDRLIGIGFVLNFVKFILFTFGDKEMISVIEAGVTELGLSEPGLYENRCDVENPVEDGCRLDNSSLNRIGRSIIRLGWVDGKVPFILSFADHIWIPVGIVDRTILNLVRLDHCFVERISTLSCWYSKGCYHRTGVLCSPFGVLIVFLCLKFGISSWRGSRVDGRSYLQNGAIDGSKANRIIRDSKQEVWNDCMSFKVRISSNGNLLWEVSVLLGRKKGGVRVAREDDRGVSKGREDVREVFQQRGSGAKRKLSRCGRNQMGNEPILALPEGVDDFVVYYDARSKDLEACLEKGEGDCFKDDGWMLFSEFDFEAKYHLGKANVDVVPWSRKKAPRPPLRHTRIVRDRCTMIRSRDRGVVILVRQGSDLHLERCKDLAIEEAYTTKYSIHPGADTMLCGFRLTNRWLSMKEDIASCGSKYLAYLEVEVEYQGSSGLLLQPELPE